MHFLWFDTETGGLSSKIHTLLTAYFAVCDQDLNIIDELYLQLKPEEIGKILVEAKAMEINGINLEEHLKDPNTTTYAEGAAKLKEMLIKNKIKGKRKHYIPCGHNIGFDKNFLFDQLIPQEDFEKLVHYNDLDTLDATMLLKDCGIFPPSVGSLTSLVKYFDLQMGDAHTARGDVLMNIEVYKSIKKLLQSKKTDMVGSSSESLLKIVEA